MADPVAPALVGVKTMVDAVAPPSIPAPESSRRARIDVKEDAGLTNSGSKSDSFGPMRTMGEPSCLVSQRDSGSNNLQVSDDLWAICPTVHSALYMMIRTAAISTTMITHSSCQLHEC